MAQRLSCAPPVQLEPWIDRVVVALVYRADERLLEPEHQGAEPPQAPEQQPVDRPTRCGSWAFAKSVGDADGDVESARWRVDGVLMQEGITSMALTQPHLLELVVRDARGATVTRQQNVGCL
jgi:hypothetical protein